MDILTKDIVEVHGEVELSRVIKVNMTTDCYGCKKTETLGFFKSEWPGIKARGHFLETKGIWEDSIPYFENMSEEEWNNHRYATKLSRFSDEEIVEEFNKRINSPFHKIVLLGQATIKR